MCSLWQVASATSTFAMVFSSSMSVVQYYLLERFPVPYGMTAPIREELMALVKNYQDIFA